MPFKSEKQRRYLWANEPEIARDWTETYGSRIHKEGGGIADLKIELEKYAPEGEFLAFINEDEADLLKSRGAYGKPINESGVPSFAPWDKVFKPFKKVLEVPKKLLKTVKKLTKHPLGKALLAAAAYKYGPAMFQSAGNQTGGAGWRNIFDAKGWKLPNIPFIGDETATNVVDGSWKFSPEAMKTTKLGTDWMAPENLGNYVNLEKADFIPKATKAIEKTSLIPGISNKTVAMIGLPTLLAGATTQEQQPEEFFSEEDRVDTTVAPVLAELEKKYGPYRFMVNQAAEGGRIGYSIGGDVQEGGLMNLGGLGKDYRNTGGFVPIGGQEKADDVPARLSRNEYVMTADAVRGAGQGNVDKGAVVMETLMDKLQGKHGKQEMFETSERLSEVL